MEFEESRYVHSSAAMPFLTRLIEDLERDVDVYASVAAAISLTESDVLAQAWIDNRIRSKSPMEVALWLIEGHPAWAPIWRLPHTAAWITEFQIELDAALDSPKSNKAKIERLEQKLHDVLVEAQRRGQNVKSLKRRLENIRAICVID